MKKRLLSAAFLLSGVMSMQAQVGIGTLNPNNSAMLEVASTDKGILIPRIALASKTDTTTITNGNVNSLLVFNTTNNDEIQPGYYYWFEDSWKKLAILEDINQETVTVLNALDAAVYEYISEDNTSTIINVPQDVINNFTTITNDENVFNHLVEIIHNNAGNVYYDGSTFTYLDENNVFQTINFEEIVQNYETATTLVYNSITNELIYTDENGEEHTYVLNNTKITGFTIENHIATIFDSEGQEFSIDLSNYLDNTDEQEITELSITDNILTISIENGNTKTVDLTTLLNGTHLEAGEHIQISGTGDADDPYVISSVNTTNETLVIEENILKLIDSDGTELSVSLNDYLDNTDSQNITELYLEGDQLVIAIENGNTKTVDLSYFFNTTTLQQGEHITITGTGTIEDPYIINAEKTTLSEGSNVTIEETTDGLFTNYTISVPTANGNALGVVKEAAVDPTVLISSEGELSINFEALTDFKEVTQDYAATNKDFVLFGNAIGNTINITLPSPVGNKGKKLTIKKSDANENAYVNVTTVAGNIEGIDELYTSLPHSGWDLMSDGQNWRIVNKF